LNPDGYYTAWTAVQDRVSHGAEAFAQPGTGTQYSAGVVRLFKWMNNTTSSSTPGGTVRTFPLTFDNKKTRKRLHFIRLYVSSESPTYVDPVLGTLYGWRVRLVKDRASDAIYATPTQEYDAAYKQIVSPANYPIDSGTDAELIVTDAALSPDTPIIGYCFDIQVTFPNHASEIIRLYRMEIGWSTISEGMDL
jgi:hypothetical protein